MTDSQYVDHLMATKSDRPEIKAIQRHVAWLRSVVAAKGLGVTCPDIKRLTIRRSNNPGRNTMWIGATKVKATVIGQAVELDMEVPAYVQVLRDEVIRNANAQV
jgi:hypothetical protein